MKSPLLAIKEAVETAQQTAIDLVGQEPIVMIKYCPANGLRIDPPCMTLP